MHVIHLTHIYKRNIINYVSIPRSLWYVVCLCIFVYIIIIVIIIIILAGWFKLLMEERVNL